MIQALSHCFALAPALRLLAAFVMAEWPTLPQRQALRLDATGDIARLAAHGRDLFVRAVVPLERPLEWSGLFPAERARKGRLPSALGDPSLIDLPWAKVEADAVAMFDPPALARGLRTALPKMEEGDPRRALLGVRLEIGSDWAKLSGAGGVAWVNPFASSTDDPVAGTLQGKAVWLALHFLDEAHPDELVRVAVGPDHVGLYLYDDPDSPSLDLISLAGEAVASAPLEEVEDDDDVDGGITDPEVLEDRDYWSGENTGHPSWPCVIAPLPCLYMVGYLRDHGFVEDIGLHQHPAIEAIRALRWEQIERPDKALAHRIAYRIADRLETLGLLDHSGFIAGAATPPLTAQQLEPVTQVIERYLHESIRSSMARTLPWLREERNIEWQAVGDTVDLLVPGAESLPCRYAVVRACQLIASHDPTHGFAPRPDYPWRNTRDYERQPALQAAVLRDAANLSPAILLDLGAGAENGPPIVTDTGAVVGGNSRTMKLLLALRKKGSAWRHYEDALRLGAGRFGLAAGVWTDDAVLVRRLWPMDEVSLNGLIPLLNEPAALADSTDEGVFAMARNISDRAIAYLSGVECSEGQTLRQALKAAGVLVYNSMENQGAIPRGRRNRYVDDSAGELTSEGLNAMEGAIMARMAGGDLDLFRSLPSNFKNVALRAAGPLLQVQALVKEDLLPTCADISAPFSAALRRAAEQGKDPDQGSLFGSPPPASRVEEAMGRLVSVLSGKRGGLDSRRPLEELAAMLVRYRRDLGDDMFGDALDEDGVITAITTVAEMAK